MINVMIVDDDIVVRKGIKAIAENISGANVVVEASSGEEALTQARNHSLDIALVDIQMPGMGGYETMTRLLNHYPKLKVIVFSVFSSGLYPRHFLKAGASGYLAKGVSSNELEIALKKVYAGGTYIADKVAQNIVLGDGNDNSPNELKTRELQVLHLIASGCSNDEMAENLNLSKKTISRQRQMLYAKLNVENDVQLARIAISKGIFETNSADFNITN